MSVMNPNNNQNPINACTDERFVQLPQPGWTFNDGVWTTHFKTNQLTGGYFYRPIGKA